MKPQVGTINIEAYRNREGRFIARVTLTDPTWTWEPYVIPPQLVGTTETPRARLDETLKDASELAQSLAMKAVIVAGMRKENG